MRKSKREMKTISDRALAALEKSQARYGSVTKVGAITKVQWCIVHCNAGQDRIAAAGIIARGLMAYEARFRERRRINAYSQRTREVEAALFPGYIFAGFQEGTFDWRIICSRPGVRRVLAGGAGEAEVPCVVPAEFIAELQGHEMELVTKTIKKPKWKVGDVARVIAGPFATFYANVISLDAPARITALIDMFGRPVPVQLDVAAIEKI